MIRSGSKVEFKVYSLKFREGGSVYPVDNLADVGNRASSQAVDEKITLTVVPDIDADFIRIVFPDDRELIRDALPSASSFPAFRQVQHFIAEHYPFSSGLRNGISASEIGQITCRHGIANDDESAVAGNADILVGIRSCRL